jgi:predicted signal transduction protein with EAL and GGDEF domain
MDQCMKHSLNDDIETSRPARPQPSSSVEISRLYRAEIETNRKKAARQGLWIAVIVYLIFSVTDYLLVPDVVRETVAARFAVGITVLLIIEAQVRFDVRAKWLDLTCAAALVCGYLGWLSFALTTQDTESMSHYMVFGTIFMMGANLFFSFRFRLSLLTSGIVLVIFFAALFSAFPNDNNYALSFGTFYLACFVFTSYVNWRLNRERYNVFLNALEAKIQHNEASERGKALLRLSNTDYLTGLENRRAIDQRLRDYWNDWQTHGTNFTAILVDVDFFKKYNDFYGHQEGDR